MKNRVVTLLAITAVASAMFIGCGAKDSSKLPLEKIRSTADSTEEQDIIPYTQTGKDKEPANKDKDSTGKDAKDKKSNEATDKAESTESTDKEKSTEAIENTGDTTVTDNNYRDYCEKKIRSKMAEQEFMSMTADEKKNALLQVVADLSDKGYITEIDNSADRLIVFTYKDDTKDSIDISTLNDKLQ